MFTPILSASQLYILEPSHFEQLNEHPTWLLQIIDMFGTNKCFNTSSYFTCTS